MGKIKEKFFKKVLEKPINDFLYVSYQIYYNSCRVYLDDKDIISLDDYSKLINEKLKDLYSDKEV